jgi:DNA polymerase elongation subunit (family B)
MKDPKIVVFDLETLPNLRQALKVWPQLSNFPGLTLRATVSSIICFGYKQYTVDKKAKCVSAWDFPNWEIDVNDDSEVCKIAYEVLNDADAVVTHNGKRFDWRHLQTRLKANKLPLLPKIPHIDTKEIAKRHLYSFSNRLDYLGDWVVGERKLDHDGWELWEKVWERDPKALATMTKYCKQDVDLDEKLFVELKPFIGNLPNYNLFQNEVDLVCPSCGSSRLLSNGYRHTKTKSYKRLQCKDCGSWSRLDMKDRNPRSI